MGRARVWLLCGAVAGAVAAYLLDPDTGRRRRAQLRDRMGASGRRAERQVEGWRERARDRARGLAHEVGTPEEPPRTDRALVDKVRSEVLGGPDWRPYTINVNAVDGVVTLRGQLDRPEQVRALRSAVAAVPGVREVKDFLHLPGTPAPNVQHIRQEH